MTSKSKQDENMNFKQKERNGVAEKFHGAETCPLSLQKDGRKTYSIVKIATEGKLYPIIHGNVDAMLLYTVYS